MLTQVTAVMDVRSTEVTELTDAAEAEALRLSRRWTLRLPRPVDKGDGAAAGQRGAAMLLQATDVTEVRSSQLSELTDAAEAEAL